MKILKRTKKGFTLVELIVVIAIVAILAAVSVVSYLSFINQANESADIQLVKQLNVALQADEILNGKRPTMHEMLGAMEENGFVVENLTKTKSGYDIVWDQENNRFALTKADNTLVYGESTYDSNVKITKWKFVDNNDDVSTATNQKYSIYLTEEFAKKNVTKLSVKFGLDVGNCSRLTNISYINDKSSTQSVVIRTNGGTLTVNAPNDTVNHYGYAKQVNVESIGGASYHEFGNVKQIVVNSGHIVTEKTAVILSISAEPTEGEKVSIDVTKKMTEVVVSGEFASQSEDISIIGTTSVPVSAALVSALDEAKTYSPDATRVPSTFVIDKENKTITIKDEVALLYYGYVLDHKAALTKDGGVYTSFWYNDGRYNTPVRIILDCDIDFENARFDKGMNADFGGEFDGQNHTIKNVVIEDGLYGAAGLFDSIQYLNFKDLTLENIKVTTNQKTVEGVENTCAGILASSATQPTQDGGIKNITIKNSSVTGAKYTGAVVGYAYADIKNCVVIDCTVSGQYKMGGIVGYVAAENNSVRLINKNSLTNVSITAYDIMEGKTAVVGKVVGNFNSNGECKDNTFTNVTGSENNIGKIESGKIVEQY